MHEINWPETFTPGLTDLFLSNEKIVHGLSVEKIWSLIGKPWVWPTFHPVIHSVSLADGDTEYFGEGSLLVFEIGEISVNAEIKVYDAPTANQPAQIAWIGQVNAGSENEISAYFAWLIEPLTGGRVRLLAQESLLGKPAQAIALMRPNPALNAHYEWLMNLIDAAQQGTSI